MRITTALDSTSLTTRYPKTALATTLFFMLALPFLLYLVLLLMLPFNRPEALNAVAQRLGWDLGHSLYRDTWYGVILLVEGTFVSLYTAVFAGAKEFAVTHTAFVNALTTAQRAVEPAAEADSRSSAHSHS